MDTTSNGLTDPSWSSSSSSPLWDVFLSFYGKDTRRNFIANLYFALDQAGIQTFRDDPALGKGQEISLGLLNAIKDSKMFVVVLSENYALSSWCLNELVEILSCKRTKNQVVVPVFYYVDPSDIRHQKGSFGEALDFHKKSYSVDLIEKWKYALAEIAELSGYHLKKYASENESDTVQEIVMNVAQQATTKILHLEEYLFGVDSAVEEIYQKLNMESNDVRAIGICGMGGIGKTTTAKAFYNKYSNKFDISCFVENVKQSVQGGHLLPLLEQLLIELLRRKDYKVPDVERGIRQLKQILCSKKALIVLDDMNQSSYSELLVRLSNLVTTRSRIMITTRDSNMLDQLKVDIPDVDIYMVKKLNRIDSLELFSYHAFRKPVPPIIFGELSASFVTYAGGIPLALKVLGSSLCGRPHVSFWKAKLEKVREIPDKEIQKILQLSYDELDDEMQKTMFLDVVFFFIGEDKDEAIHVFKSCHFYPEAGIPILVERCLLTIDENNKFQMHNLIQDMGREVIREESKHGKCRHLYLCQENACEVLQNLSGTDKIEGLILDLTMWRKRNFSAKIFERLPNLRLLEIFEAHDVRGNFENSFHELRCIRWRYCPWTRLPSSFLPRKLVSLDMQFSEFKTLWKDNKYLLSLKTLNVSYSKNLKTTPNFRELKSVEKLLLRGCERLMKIHPSIGQLTDLGHLDLSECYRLRKLPEPIGQLTKLGRLHLRDCHSLKRLPEPVKQLANLGCLDLAHCRNLRGLPEQLGQMKAMKMLDASYTAIEKLPDSVAHLSNLVELKLVSCKKLKKLPKQLGYMQCLETFDASLSAIEQLPDSFGHMINMIEVNLGSCKNLTSLPDSIWRLKFLRVLNLQYCSKLESLPDQLGKLQCLEELNASCTSIEELPDSIGLLSRLQVLHLYSCEKLKHVTNSIGNLTSLSILYLGINNAHTNLPDSVKNMKLLTILDLSCNIRLCLPIITNLSSLETLDLTDEGECLPPSKPFSLSKLSNLRDLTLNNCTSLGSSFPELPLNLTNLSLYNHTELRQLPDLSSLKQLEKLYIYGCTRLQSLSLLPPRVEKLVITGCTSLQNIPDMSILMDLIHLDLIRNSSNLRVILKDSSLVVGRHFFTSFRATLPNRKIPEWFSYKSSGCTVTFDIPPTVVDNFLGVAIWAVYSCKNIDPSSYCRVYFTNKTKGTTKNFRIYAPIDSVGEVHSKVHCVRGKTISVNSGDRVEVSVQRLLYSSSYGGDKVQTGEVKVKMLGAHVIQKTPSTP